MKGASSCHIYTDEGRQNHSRVKRSEVVGPYQVWRNRITDDTMRLPIGVTAGKNWEPRR